MAKVNVFLPQSDRQSHRKTGQKLDAPEFHSGGIIIEKDFTKQAQENLEEASSF